MAEVTPVDKYLLLLQMFTLQEKERERERGREGEEEGEGGREGEWPLLWFVRKGVRISSFEVPGLRLRVWRR